MDVERRRGIAATVGRRRSKRSATVGCRPSKRSSAVGCDPSKLSATVGCRPPKRSSAVGCDPSKRSATVGCRPPKRSSAVGCDPSKLSATVGCRPSKRSSAVGCDPSKRSAAERGRRSRRSAGGRPHRWSRSAAVALAAAAALATGVPAAFAGTGTRHEDRERAPRTQHRRGCPPRAARRAHPGCRNRATGTGEIVDLAVAFSVQNVNRSDAPCPSDGATYTIRGHIVAPRELLVGARDRSVTLYLHGSLIGESVWRSPLPGYDWALEQARAGHASVTIDQLGFGASGLPNGLQVCVGSWADAAHQVVQELRAGDYGVAGGSAVRFRRVALASYCFGGLIAQVEAYSFDDVDAFVMLSSAFDQGYSPATTADILTNPQGPTVVCSAGGGEPKYPGGPGGYAYVFKGTEASEWFRDADPAVIDAVVRDHEREPCGEGPSLAPALAADRAFLGQISVPVLLVFGVQDAIFPPPDGERQKALFTGSSDVTLVQLDDTGHALQLGRTVPAARAAVGRWLATRGF